MVVYSFDLVPSHGVMPMLLVAGLVFLLGMVMLARERGTAVSISLLALTISVSIWLSGVAMMMMVTTPRAAFVFARIAYVGVALIPAAVLQFTISLLGLHRRMRSWLITAWSSSAGFALVFLTTRTMLRGTWHFGWGYYPRLAPLAASFLIFFATILVGSVALLATAKPKSEQERSRNRSFLIALLAGYFGSIDYIPAFGVDVRPFGFVAIFAFICLAVHAIVRYQLADLTPSFVADRLLQTMQGGVIVVDTLGRIRVANQVAAQLLGRPQAALTDADFCSLVGESKLPLTKSESFCRRSIARDRIVKWPRGDGSTIELQLSASAVRDGRGAMIGVLYAFDDFSDHRRAEANEFGATHDQLTRIPNRSQFARIFNERAVQIATTRRVLCVLFIDLDGFKNVNDQHGHAIGDSLLQLVASRIRNAIRGDDVLARYGGDEFTVLLDLARIDDASIVGAKLLRVVSESYSIDDQRIIISASIGAAFHPRDGQTVDDLVRAADVAMYRAKRAGKGRMLQIREDREAPPPFSVSSRA